MEKKGTRIKVKGKKGKVKTFNVRKGSFRFDVKCDECGHKFKMDDSDGACPKCYNPITEEQVVS